MRLVGLLGSCWKQAAGFMQLTVCSEKALTEHHLSLNFKACNSDIRVITLFVEIYARTNFREFSHRNSICAKISTEILEVLAGKFSNLIF